MQFRTRECWYQRPPSQIMPVTVVEQNHKDLSISFSLALYPSLWQQMIISIYSEGVSNDKAARRLLSPPSLSLCQPDWYCSLHLVAWSKWYSRLSGSVSKLTMLWTASVVSHKTHKEFECLWTKGTQKSTGHTRPARATSVWREWNGDNDRGRRREGEQRKGMEKKREKERGNRNRGRES